MTTDPETPPSPAALPQDVVFEEAKAPPIPPPVPEIISRYVVKNADGSYLSYSEEEILEATNAPSMSLEDAKQECNEKLGEQLVRVQAIYMGDSRITNWTTGDVMLAEPQPWLATMLSEARQSGYEDGFKDCLVLRKAEEAAAENKDAEPA